MNDRRPIFEVSKPRKRSAQSLSNPRSGSKLRRWGSFESDSTGPRLSSCPGFVEFETISCIERTATHGLGAAVDTTNHKLRLTPLTLLLKLGGGPQGGA